MPDSRTRYPGIYERTTSGRSVYVARVRVKGRGAESKTFDRLTDAKEWHRKRASEVKAQQVFGHSRATLLDAIERYLSEELPRLAPSERRNRERHLSWWKEAGEGGRLLLRDLTRSWARERVRSLREKGLRGRPLSYATGNRYLAALSALLSACEDWEWIERNPLHHSGRRKKAKGEREKVREREEVQEEIERLKSACKESRDPRLLSLFLLALSSGAREGELVRLAWKEVELEPMDFDAATGEKRRGVPRAKTIDPKNGDDRILYFPGEAGEVLRTLAPNRFRSPFVFAEPDDPKREPVFPSGAWRYAKKKAEVADLRFHDLRHFWACRLLDSGATIPQLMVLGGWRSIVAMRIYIARSQRQGSAPVEAMHRRG